MIKVAIIEDDEELLGQLVAIIEDHTELSCCGSFADAESALIAMSSMEVDVFLLDINLPGMSGVDLVRPLLREKPEARVLMHTVFEDDEKLFAALRAGADGYLLKRSSLEELLHAIQDVFEGGSPMTPHIARKVVRSFYRGEASEPELEPLTAREEEVLKLVAQGYSNKEVAKELDINPDTVRVHLRHIFQKWQVSNRTQAVTTYLDQQH